MSGGTIRRAAVAGSWYPRKAAELEAAVDACLAGAERPVSSADGKSPLDEIVAIVAPHAGLVYSGPVAGHAYRTLQGRPIELAVLVGPSHFTGFDGVAIWRRGVFETPLGSMTIDEGCSDRLLAEMTALHERPSVHEREHSLEMQLPFLKRVLPEARIVPLLMGWQTAETARALGRALAAAVDGRRAIVVASTDLSHYHDAPTAARLDGVVINLVRSFDPGGLQQALDANPEHACGGGPLVAVMAAARMLGASEARVLHYGDSGDVSGDKGSVVGYLAAAFGRSHVAAKAVPA